MSKKNKIAITREDDFAEVEAELTSALEMLDGANERVESLLREQKQSETEAEPAPQSEDGEPAAQQEA